jgi:hypothetical protein
MALTLRAFLPESTKARRTPGFDARIVTLSPQTPAVRPKPVSADGDATINQFRGAELANFGVNVALICRFGCAKLILVSLVQFA